MTGLLLGVEAIWIVYEWEDQPLGWYSSRERAEAAMAAHPQPDWHDFQVREVALDRQLPLELLGRSGTSL